MEEKKKGRKKRRKERKKEGMKEGEAEENQGRDEEERGRRGR